MKYTVLHNTSVTKQWTTKWPYIGMNETFRTWRKIYLELILIYCFPNCKNMLNKLLSYVSSGAIAPIAPSWIRPWR